MKIIISGSSGLVGTALIPVLKAQGHEVTRLVRAETGPGKEHWDPEQGELKNDALEGFDVVIHLAGENIASGRWTADRKKRIYRSRVEGTRLVTETLARIARPQRFCYLLRPSDSMGIAGQRF